MRLDPPPLPRDKFDTEAANEIACAGWPHIEPIASQLLGWLQDANWPVAKVLTPALVKIGAPLGPYVRQVLQTGDETWKYHMVEQLVAQSPELARALRPDLERIALSPTQQELAEQVDCVARKALENA